MKKILSFLSSPGSLDPKTSLGLLVLRLAFGGTMVVAHGWGKLTNFSAVAEKFPAFFGLSGTVNLALAVGAEVGAALLLCLGLFTRAAALPLLATMLVAFFLAHGSDPFKVKELAFLYGLAFIALFFTGAGRYSADAVLGRR